MKVQKFLNALEAYLQEEIGSRGRTLEILESQVAAIAKNDPAELQEASEALSGQLARDAQRTKHRQVIFLGLSREWGIALDSMTVRSVADRAQDLYPESAKRLRTLRTELRRSAAEVLRLNRRVSALMGVHSRVIHDTFQILFEEEGGSPFQGAGALINAEA